jgi:hypothetical protein
LVFLQCEDPESQHCRGLIQKTPRKKNAHICLEMSACGNEAGRPVIDASRALKKGDEVLTGCIGSESEGMTHDVL